MTLAIKNKVVQKKKIIFKKIGAEVHILNPELGTICSLNETGSFLWDSMKKPIRIAALIDSMCKHYAVDKKTARADVLEITEKLLKATAIKKVA